MGAAYLRQHLGAWEDGASLGAFRAGLGLLLAASAARFAARGWVEALYLTPAWRFAWVPWAVCPPAAGLYGLLALVGLGGLLLAVGWRPRLSLAVALGAFVYLELLDKALYLNHYVLITLLGLTLLLAPAPLAGPWAPRWLLWLLRTEVGLVYTWAGLHKLNADWLLRGEPLHPWLRARADLPGVGPLLARPETALAMGWAGALYDLSIVGLLLWPRTRRLALAAVVVFHALTGALFPIGAFPWLMILCSSLFLDPDWPRRLLRRPSAGAPPPGVPLSRGGLAVLGALTVGLALWPGRSVLYPGEVRWTEVGFRLSWRVMLIEKTGFVEYRVVEPGTGRAWRIDPGAELTPLQHKQLRTQPDLIAQYARHLAERFPGARVYADAWASLNGRPAQRLIDPAVDLAVPEAALPSGWIVPLAGE